MTDYQSNSKKSKEASSVGKSQKKVIEQVVSSDEVVVRKKPIGKRFKEIFFGGEGKSVLRYIAADVLLPAARNLVVDATTEGVKRMMYGESHTTSRTGAPYAGRTSYNRSPIRNVDPRTEARLPRQGPRPYPSRQQETEIILSSREAAERVLEGLTDILDAYEVVSVADLHELMNLPVAHVDNKWGWTYLGGIEILQVREGWLLNLPPTEPI
jgi:hypothetical protein